MATRKRSISFDADVLGEAERVARDSEFDGNVSGLVNDAVARELRLRGLRDYLAETEAELGPIPEWARKEAERIWPE
jgi:hypothetical protein